MVFPLFGPAAFSGSAGKITGHVIDAETNDPLVVVNILIEGTRMGAATDVNGEYTILNVPPGTIQPSGFHSRL